MTVVLLMRLVAGILGSLPAPVRKALDAWSYRVALKRRARRFQGVRQRAVHAK